MFNHSANIVINGGTFAIQNPGLNPDIRRPRRKDSYVSGSSGLDILYAYIAPGAMHDSAERSNAPACHPDTRTKILADVRSWIADDNRKTRVLWIHGPAGSGKTAICQTLAEQCEEDEDLAAAFFFEGGSAGRDDARLLVTTIAYQIANNIEPARDHISNAVLKNPQQILEKTLRVQMRDLLIKPLQQAVADASTSVPHARLLLIDGLDECRPWESQEDILRVIHDAVTRNRFPLCIIISSRREPQIRDAFEGYLQDITRTIALDATLNPDQDIRTYLRSSFADILHKHRHNPVLKSLTYKWPSEATIQTLVAKASGQFIYATTVVRFVDVRHETPTKRLEIAMELSNYKEDDSDSGHFARPFSELDKLYQKVFGEVYDIQLTLRILGCIILLRAPIDLVDLEDLLKLEPGAVEISLSKLHSVLDVFDDPSNRGRFVRFYHESLKEFLLNSRRSGQYYIASDLIHRELSQCLSPYNPEVQYSLTPYSISIPFFHHSSAKSSNDKFSRAKPLNLATLPEWVYHMSMLGSESLDDALVAFRGAIAHRNGATRVTKKLKERYDRGYLSLSQVELNDLVDQLSTLIDKFKHLPGKQHSDIIELYTTALDLHFKCHLAMYSTSSEIQLTTLVILAMIMQDTLSTPAAAFGLLLHLDWSGFVDATLPLRYFMSFRPSIKFISQAFAEFIEDPDRSKEFNPMSDSIHADLTICCVEFIKKSKISVDSAIPFLSKESQSYPDSDGLEKAFLYAEANWRRHLSRGNSQRLLSYIHFVAARDGYPPKPCKIHDQLQCNDFCKVIRVFQCVERARKIVDLITEPLASTAFAEYLRYLKEIIEIKCLDVPQFSSLKPMMEKWSQRLDLTLLETPKEALLAERSEMLRRNDFVQFPYAMQGVLWASRKNYSGKWPT
ncbi:hypothetical protein HYPSUDRAFT_40843 [Hypholoma sublateritium FD-334 SS-4]|uniref:Nephrocystin 3-like N-terminal domain-containing protein n=1 Tax=Hypholoma sublateritium (strain FD-334 SS-4) TaxID=945553 RepID=A0A0D2MFT9_HYPSF|nr:hypothetical protein HYPSUDRAFT_40843 [Hypholoma sublateritium FD-334 SS-4]